MNDTEAMTAYLSSLQQAEFVDFYRKVKETHAALYIGGRQREVFTSEILEFKQMDPARWIKACRLAGIHSEVDMRVTNLAPYLKAYPYYPRMQWPS